ncbi:MAG TPA: GNAT family N-acetyltransferase [Gaiellaceae bacterium]|nr:GNAT family N-acetyltransferase [Gaiellaceae bacterium]
MTPPITPSSTTTAEDVVLRDGSTLRLRSTAPSDGAALVAFFDRLSPESRYLRFQGAGVVDLRTVEPFLHTDWRDSVSLVGELGGDVVALGTFIRLRDPRRAEVAFAVADELQGRGIGTRLLERLALHAAGAGIEEFVAQVLPQNAHMLNVFADAGFGVSRRLEEGVVEVRLTLAATEAYRLRLDERDHVAVTASVRPFFTPETVAVIGASSRRGTIGGELFRNILTGDFKGAAYPINARGEPVGGVPAYSSIEDVPAAIDLAVICVPGAAVLDAAEAALRKGVRALCVISAGFAEVGREGQRRQDELLALVRSHGARLIGPNCLGIASSSMRLNATFAGRAFPPGRAAFSSQSGALGIALLEQAEQRGLGLSAFVSIGNKADVSSNDLLEYWEDDPDTDLVLLYLESFGNPGKFARIARRVARSKPILAMRSGTSSRGARAASSHTAALAGSDAAVEALFRQTGVLRANTLEELIDTAVLLSSQPLPLGNRVAVVTNAGGMGILAADACDQSGLALPDLADETRAKLAEFLPREASTANPVDLLGSAVGETYARALPIILDDPGVDAVLAMFVLTIVADTEDVVAAIKAVARAAEKPVVPVIMSAEGAPRGSFAYPESAARALGLAAGRAAWLRRPAGVVPELEGIDAGGARKLIETALERSSDTWLDSDRTRRLLGAYGLPLVGERVALTPDEAVAAAVELGLPAVVKTAAAGAHKTESGGVALDLRAEDDVRAAAERIGCPVLVQPYLTGSVELLAGVVQDPVFGPLVAFGPGGTMAELIGDARFALAPLTDVDVELALAGGKAGKLIAGWRGAPPADRAALSSLLHRLSRLAVDHPEVAELDLNPVLAGPDGCVAVDARVRLRRVERATSTKTW